MGYSQGGLASLNTSNRDVTYHIAFTHAYTLLATDYGNSDSTVRKLSVYGSADGLLNHGSVYFESNPGGISWVAIGF